MGMLKKAILVCGTILGIVVACQTLHAQNWSWATGISGVASVSSDGIAVDASGNTYVTGYFEGSADFGNGILLNGAVGQTDIYVAKFDALGTAIWAVKGGMSQNDYSREIALDGLGGVYVTGSFTDSLRLTMSMGSTIVYSAGELDVFLAKLDANTGNALWLKSAGGPSSDEGTSLTLGSNKVFVAGMHAGMANFDAVTLNSYGLTDAFVACYNETTANWTWAKTAGTPSIDQAWGICTDGTNIFATGFYEGAVFNFGTTNLSGIGNVDGFVTKLDINGNTAWSARIGAANQNESPTSIASDGQNVFVTGNASGQATIEFSGTPVVFSTPPGQNTDFWVCKMDATTGNCQWATSEGGSGTDISNSILITGSNTLTVGGSFENAISLAGNALTGPGLEIFLESFDATNGLPSAAFQATGPGGAVVQDIAIGSGCNIFATGKFDQILHFSSYQITSNAGSGGFVAQLDPLGAMPPRHDDDSLIACFGDSVTVRLLGNFGNVSWESSTDNGATWVTVVGMNSDTLRVSPSVTTWYRSTYTGPCYSGRDSTWVGVGGMNIASVIGLPSFACLSGAPIPFSVMPRLPLGTITVSPLGFANLGMGSIQFDPVAAGLGLHFIRYDYIDNLGCRSSASDTIEVYNLPPVSFAALNPVYCAGSPDTILLTGSMAPQGSFPSSDTSLVDLGNGIGAFYPHEAALDDSICIMYMVRDTNGCVAVDSQWTYVSSVPAANAGLDSLVCSGNSVELGTPSLPGINYLWTAMGTSWTSTLAQPNVAPISNQTYVLQVQNGFGCSDTDTTSITVIPFPLADAGSDQTICRGDSLTLGGTIPSGYSVNWHSNQGFQSNFDNPTVAPTLSEEFVLVLTDSSANCANADSILVNVVVPAPGANAGADQTLAATGTLILDGSDPSPGQGLWVCNPNSLTVSNPQAADATIEITQPGTWTMVWQVTNAPCPTTRDSMTISVSLLRFPNGFSPNDDHVNDVLFFEGLEAYPQNKLLIFSRWGEEIRNFEPYQNDWDGTNLNGQPLVEDTYYYILELEEGNSVNQFLVLKR
jgi:gliding motility-associated-like protein